MTHTYVTLEVTWSTYEEIRSKLLAAGYDHAVSSEHIDMHGLALTPPGGPDPYPGPLPVTDDEKAHALRHYTGVVHQDD